MRSFGAQWAGKKATGPFFCAQTPTLKRCPTMEVSPAVVGPLRRGTITVVATGLGGMLHTFSFLTESWHRAKARLRGTPKRLPECIELWRLWQGYSQHIPKRTVRALRRIAVSFSRKCAW